MSLDSWAMRQSRSRNAKRPALHGGVDVARAPGVLARAVPSRSAKSWGEPGAPSASVSLLRAAASRASTAWRRATNQAGRYFAAFCRTRNDSRASFIIWP
jgi:hypothetical protein